MPAATTAQLFTGSMGIQLYGGNTFTSILSNTSNTYSGGTVFGNGTGTTFTRLFASGTIGSGSPGALTSGIYGTGAITVGASTTDRVQFYIFAAATINNNLVINSEQGNGVNEFGAFRLESSGNTIAGAINANLADLKINAMNGGGRTLTITGAISGSYGLNVTTASSGGLEVTLNNAGTANSYAGNTTISTANSTLTLGRANQIANGAGKGNLIINSGTFKMGGYNETINGLSGNGTIDGVSGTPTLTIGDNDATSTFSGLIKNTSGSLALTKIGSGTLTLSNASNTYTGATTINAGTISISAVGALGSTSGVNLGNAAELVYTGSAATLSRAISVTSGTATVSNTGSGLLTLSGGLSKNGTTLVLDGGSNGINVTGAITGSAANSDLVVDGNVTLSTANTYNGPTTINGNLTANATNAMGSTTNVVINSGGSLLVTADNAINDSATINMTGGTLSFSGNVTETVGMLTLSANSIIDLGTDSVAASFADLAMGFYNLSIYNWTGTTLSNGGDGNNTDRIYFNRTLTDSELGRISFYSDFGSGFLGNGFQIMSGGFANEVIPVPEPETWATAALLLLGGGAWMWRRRKEKAANRC
jgi:autotransporter-associated beta strand protein